MADYTPNATISERRDLTPELAVIRVRPDAGVVPAFEPGQYGELAVPTKEELAAIAEGKPGVKIIRRSYSIASTPRDNSYLEFYLVLVPGGEVTPKIWSLQSGDRLWLGPKVKGKFTLHEIPKGHDYIMISTGTGIAPFVSMLRHFRDDPPWRKLVLIHGARLSQDLGYREELEAVAREDKNVIYIPSVTREPESSSWSGLRGRVQVALQDDVYQRYVGTPLHPETSQVFLCGNPDMIDAIQADLERKGFKVHHKKNPGNIHLERYW